MKTGEEPSSIEQADKASEHAWRYFALHSQQRTTVFNFFVASLGLTLSGLAYVLANHGLPRYFGLMAGVGVGVLSFTFWKLDQRVVQLIKISENIMRAAEASRFDEPYRVFTLAEYAPVNVGLGAFKPWSYGRSFRLIFALAGLLGFAGAAASLIASRNAVPPPKLTTSGAQDEPSQAKVRNLRQHEATNAQSQILTVDRAAPRKALQKPN